MNGKDTVGKAGMIDMVKGTKAEVLMMLKSLTEEVRGMNVPKLDRDGLARLDHIHNHLNSAYFGSSEHATN